MIRVLHILWSAHFGGIEKLVFDLATVQIKCLTLQVEIFFGRKEGEFLERFQEAGFMCYSARLNSGYDVSPWKCFHAIRLFKKYDILHFHSFNPLLSICAVISGKKIIYTEHGNFGFGRKKNLTDYLKGFLLKRFLNSYVDYISFNSQFTKECAERRYGLNSVRRSVVYNGIAFKKDNVPSGGIPELILQKLHGKFIVGTTSRFAGFKRIDRLIQAFAKFQGNKDTVLLLVGDGILRSELERLVEDLGLSKKTIFTGFRNNVREFQNLMDVCVFPSENEPFGLVAVETLSLGKPTIVFWDGGGILEVVGNFVKDDVVGDIFNLAHRLEYYYVKKDKLTKLSQKRKEYARKFDICNMSEEFTVIYEVLT